MPSLLILRFALLAALAAPLAGCPAPAEALPEDQAQGDPADAVPLPDDLVEARARWAEAGPDDYTMTLRRSCFCPVPDYTGPFAVTVTDGELASVMLEGAAVDPERGMTVGALFDLVAEAYARGAVRVDVAYDPVYGHPTRIAIDYDERIADEETGYTVTDLQPAR